MFVVRMFEAKLIDQIYICCKILHISSLFLFFVTLHILSIRNPIVEAVEVIVVRVGSFLFILSAH